jgi:ectoine hydroxylase-related dioxygenase (phytanoyl-CoA dioxygenase family)
MRAVSGSATRVPESRGLHLGYPDSMPEHERAVEVDAEDKVEVEVEAATPMQLTAHLESIAERGYTILENVLEPDLVEELASALLEIEREEGIATSNNEFEGNRTVRIYNLLARRDVFARVPIHRSVLPVVEGVLDAGCLISSISSISIDPDETAQMIHSDDQVIALPRPQPPLVCNTMWALSDFTEENGATRVVPGSHSWDHYPNPTQEYESIPAEMSRGSVLIWNGALWHGGGANRSRERRIGIAMNYCAGFIRQQENQQLGIPVEVAKGFPERLKRLVGYGVYRGLIGHIDKHDPIELLGDEGDLRILWDR